MLARRAAGYSPWCSARSVALPLGFLRELGVVPSPPAVVADGPVEEVLDGYRRYMLSERGVKERTVAGYEPDARVFLSQREGLEGLGLERLTAADVSVFLARECPLRTVAGARSLVVVLRSLLRYLHVAGLIELPLEWAVPGVADLRDRSLPRGLEPAVVKKLLASCDRRRTVGRRDYAILLLLARLGLRAGEVAAITLEDVDWRRGELLIHGKGGRDDVLPLPCDLGEALVSYLRRRPAERLSDVVLEGARARGSDVRGCRFAGLCTTRACARGSRRSDRTGSGTPRRPGCFGRARRLRRSGRCCDTASARRQRSTPRLTAKR